MITNAEGKPHGSDTEAQANKARFIRDGRIAEAKADPELRAGAGSDANLAKAPPEARGTVAQRMYPNMNP